MLTESMEAFLAKARFDEHGLVAAVVQQWDTREVLMLAWMNAETLRETLDTGRAVYYSRSRGERWLKGETSGNIQHVVRMTIDCDGDVVLLSVEQHGDACHTGARSCFDTATVQLGPA